MRGVQGLWHVIGPDRGWGRPRVVQRGQGTGQVPVRTCSSGAARQAPHFLQTRLCGFPRTKVRAVQRGARRLD